MLGGKPEADKRYKPTYDRILAYLAGGPRQSKHITDEVMIGRADKKFIHQVMRHMVTNGVIEHDEVTGKVSRKQ